jgi:aminopeptidase
MCSVLESESRRLALRHGAAFLLLTGALAAVPACSKRSGETAEAGRETSLARDTTTPKPESSGEASKALGERDYRSVAEKVVGQSARVREGDLVLINGSDEDLPLLEDLAVEVRKHGGAPLVTVVTTGLNRRMYDEVPAKYDTVAPKAALKLAGLIDVFISTEAGEERTLKGVPPERIAARGKAFSPIAALMQKRGVRQVYLGNGVYPSAEQAEQYDVSRRDLAEMLYGGVDVDYAQLQKVGEEVRRVLSGGKEVRITAPNGTDLRVQIAGRPVFVSDGIISPEEQRRRGAATTVWLPAGDVYVAPIPGTAEGVMVADQDFFQGKRIEALRLEFKGGKLASMTAKSGLDALKAQYEAAGRGKDALGVVDLGINLQLKLPADKAVHGWSRAGMVTVVVGNNTWAGGDNDVGFSVAPYLPNGTVTVDGQVLIRDGKLVAADRLATR